MEHKPHVPVVAGGAAVSYHVLDLAVADSPIVMHRDFKTHLRVTIDRRLRIDAPSAYRCRPKIDDEDDPWGVKDYALHACNDVALPTRGFVPNYVEGFPVKKSALVRTIGTIDPVPKFAPPSYPSSLPAAWDRATWLSCAVPCPVRRSTFWNGRHWPTKFARRRPCSVGSGSTASIRISGAH